MAFEDALNGAAMAGDRTLVGQVEGAVVGLAGQWQRELGVPQVGGRQDAKAPHAPFGQGMFGWWGQQPVMMLWAVAVVGEQGGVQN